MATVVGVAGGSCSGKTTLARELLDRCGSHATLLMFDDYYRELDHLTPEERAGTNFDHPDALDVDLFVRHIVALSEGRPVDVPTYDFAVHTRTGSTHVVDPAPLVLVDGILLLALPTVRAALDYGVFVDASAEVRLARRIERDVAERGRDEAGVRDQFAASVEPMHELFVHPSRVHADLALDFPFDVAEAAERVLTALGAAHPETGPWLGELVSPVSRG